MNRYPVWQSLILCFHSRSLYRDVGQNWKRQGFLFLVLLVMLVGIPRCWVFIETTTETVRQYVPLIEQIPDFRVSRGQAEVWGGKPVLIPDREGRTKMIFDTTGKYQTLENQEAVFLLTKNRVWFRKSSGVLKVVSYHPDHVVVFNERVRDQMRRFSEKGLRLFPFVSVAVLLPLILIIYLLEALVYTLLGFLISSLYRVHLGFIGQFQIALVILAPSGIAGTLFLLLSGDRYAGLPGLFACCAFFLLDLGYLVFAIRSNIPECKPV